MARSRLHEVHRRLDLSGRGVLQHLDILVLLRRVGPAGHAIGGGWTSALGGARCGLLGAYGASSSSQAAASEMRKKMTTTALAECA